MEALQQLQYTFDKMYAAFRHYEKLKINARYEHEMDALEQKRLNTINRMVDASVLMRILRPFPFLAKRYRAKIDLQACDAIDYHYHLTKLGHSYDFQKVSSKADVYNLHCNSLIPWECLSFLGTWKTLCSATTSFSPQVRDGIAVTIQFPEFFITLLSRLDPVVDNVTLTENLINKLETMCQQWQNTLVSEGLVSSEEESSHDA